MGFFKKKGKRPVITEMKCPAEGCPFTCNESALLKRHVDWKHPELARNLSKAEEMKVK